MNRDVPGVRTERGFSLIDVVIAMAVFLMGILAFVQMQSGLSRSGLDARLRTMASNLAEETIETQRRFTRLGTDPDGLSFAYEDITDGSSATTFDQMGFTVTQDVTDYYWDKASKAFTTTNGSTLAHSDFKRLVVTVSWENPLEYSIDENRATEGHLGSGNISLTTIISSSVSATSRLALLDDLSAENFEVPIVGSLVDVPELPGLPGLPVAPAVPSLPPILPGL
jgi:Tfp pilus assembly protein PilV